MQIPNTMQAFPSPALIAVTDNVRALIYHAHDRTVELLDTVTADQDHEKETEHTAFDRDLRDREHAREELYQRLSKTLERLVQQHHIMHVALCAPEERLEGLKEHLHINLLKKVFVCVGKNLTGDDPLDIVAHVQEAAS